MSDAPQGPGWWQASDGKWYPPEQAAGAAQPVPGGGAATVDVGAALSYGWNKFTQYIGQILVIVLVIFGVNIGFRIVGQVIAGSTRSAFLSLILSTFFSVAGLIVGFIIQAGVIRAALAITRGEEPDPSLLFKFDNLGPYIVASILVGLAAFLGFFVFCIGFFIVLFFTYFYGFYCIDRNMGPTDSIMASVNMVKDNIGSVLVFVIVAGVLNLITCGLAIGVTFIAGGYVYRTLNGETPV